MKITLNEIRGLNTGLNTIMARELPPLTALHFKRLMVRFVEEMKISEKTRVELAVKYGKKDDDGKPLFKKQGKKKKTKEYDLTQENFLKMGVEYDKINQKEFDIPFEPLKVEKLGKTITPDIIYQLGKLVEE